MGRDKSTHSSVEGETPILKLLLPISCKIMDELSLPIPNKKGIYSTGGTIDSELSGSADAEIPICCLDQRLAGHAAAENAESTQFLSAVDHSDREAQRVRRSGGCIPSATSAEDDEIEVCQVSILRHSLGCSR